MSMAIFILEAIVERLESADSRVLYANFSTNIVTVPGVCVAKMRQKP